MKYQRLFREGLIHYGLTLTDKLIAGRDRVQKRLA